MSRTDANSSPSAAAVAVAVSLPAMPGSLLMGIDLALLVAAVLTSRSRMDRQRRIPSAD